MAKQPTITVLSSGYFSTETLNANFTALQEHFDNFISRNGDAPNTMLGDIDMNGNDVLNVGQLDVATLTVNNIDLETYIGTSGTTADINDITFTAGDLLYFDGTNIVNLGLGAAGKVLKVNSGGTAIEWGDDLDTDTDTVGVNIEENGVSKGTNVRNLDFTTLSNTAVTYDSNTNTATIDLGDIE